jgi:hypothetical protein
MSDQRKARPRFTPRRGWVGLTAGLDTEARGKSFVSAGDRTPVVCSRILWWLRYPSSFNPDIGLSYNMQKGMMTQWRAGRPSRFTSSVFRSLSLDYIAASSESIPGSNPVIALPGWLADLPTATLAHATASLCCVAQTFSTCGPWRVVCCQWCFHILSSCGLLLSKLLWFVTPMKRPMLVFWVVTPCAFASTGGRYRQVNTTLQPRTPTSIKIVPLPPCRRLGREAV